MANRFGRYFDVSAGNYRTDKDLQNILRNLNREIVKIEGRSQEGLIRGVNQIHQETEKGAVKVPVDLGNLRHSWFYITAKGTIGKGGGQSQTPEGNAAKFVGKNAGRLATGHATLLTESIGKAKSLATMYKGPFVIAGYSANYALWVHEMLGMKNPSRPGSGPKWFEYAIKATQDKILKSIQSNARVK
jgi:hypothetical protein